MKSLKITLTVTPEIHEKMRKCKKHFNFSKLFRDALEKAIANKAKSLQTMCVVHTKSVPVTDLTVQEAFDRWEAIATNDIEIETLQATVVLITDQNDEVHEMVL